MRTYEFYGSRPGEDIFSFEGTATSVLSGRAVAVLLFRRLFNLKPTELFHYRQWAMASGYGYDLSVDQVNWVPDFPFDQFMDEQGPYIGPSRQLCFPAQEAA